MDHPLHGTTITTNASSSSKLPTDIKLPKGTKVYSNPEFSLKKGLCLVPGIQLILEDSEENAVLYVNNVSDSLAIISNDDVIALADIPRKRKTD